MAPPCFRSTLARLLAGGPNENVVRPDCPAPTLPVESLTRPESLP